MDGLGDPADRLTILLYETRRPGLVPAVLFETMNDTGFYILLTVALLIAANIAFAWWATRRHPPLGHFIEVDGVRLHMIERGDKAAPVLVMET